MNTAIAALHGLVATFGDEAWSMTTQRGRALGKARAIVLAHDPALDYLEHLAIMPQTELVRRLAGSVRKLQAMP